MAFQLDSSLNVTTLTTAFVSIVLASLVWWRRFVRLSRIRVRVEQIYSLSEQIHSALSSQEVSSQIGRGLSGIFTPCTALLFTTNPEGQLEQASGSLAVTAAARECHSKGKPGISADSFCLPMYVHGKASGVLELRGLQNLVLQRDERTALQHLANQAAISLQLLDQRRLREHILRSEKLGAAGQLISTIAAELHPSLLRIASSARELQLDPLAAEAGAALDTLDRIISYGRPDQARIQPFDLNLVVRHLADFRERAWRLQMVTHNIELPTEPVIVQGARGLIEQAILSLLVHAEQAMEAAPTRQIDVSCQSRADRAFLSIAFTGAASTNVDSFTGLAAARNLIESQGGEFGQASRDGLVRFEIAFPLSSSPASVSAIRLARKPTRPLTLLLAHPHPDALHQLIRLMGEKHHRVIPVDSAGQALDYASRLRFDAIFAARNLSDMDWTSLAERAREHSAAVGLLTSGAEPPPAGIPAITFPVDEAALDNVLASIDELSHRES